MTFPNIRNVIFPNIRNVISLLFFCVLLICLFWFPETNFSGLINIVLYIVGLIIVPVLLIYGGIYLYYSRIANTQKA